MDFATRNWFSYINENIRIDEGLRDIGLSEFVADAIEASIADAPESAKTWLGHMWKKTHLHQFVRPSNRIQEFRFNTMEPLLSALDYWTEFAKQEDLEVPRPEPQFESILKEGENWSTEKAKRTRFVLQNINKTIKDLPLGKWRKAFKKAVKALSKLGLNSETVEFVQETLNLAITKAWLAFSSRFRDTLVFLNMHPDNIRILDQYQNMVDADNKAEEEIAEQESPDQVYHTFDDGSYWYDLETSNCDIEGERMGHCGSAQSGGTMYSLRKPEGKRGKSKSFVTIEFDGETVSQIKGRGNTAPPEIMWPHIEWFIDNMGVTEVTEEGEYSDEPENFEEMNHYLESRTNANFQGSRENRMEEIAGDLNGIDYEYSGMDYCQVWWEWMDDYGDGNEIYVDMAAECMLEIDLGWPHFAVQKTGIVPLDADGNIITSFQMIPTTYSEQNDFVADAGLDDVSNMLPGEDHHGIDIEVKMMQGAIPDDWEPPEDFPNAEYPETAHLIATLRRSETVDGASASHDYSYFANQIRDEFEEKYTERVKSVMAHLQIEGYIRQNAYVKDMSKLEKINELKHWKVMADDTGAQFTFLGDKDGEAHYRLPTGLAIPTETMIYLTAGERQDSRSLIQRMFPNLLYRGGEIRAPSLNGQMAHRLSDAYGSAQRAKMAATGQEEFDFGDKYEPKPVMELAKDIELIIYPKIRHDVREPERVATLSFDFTFLVRVDSDDNVEEIDAVLAMLHHINDNPDVVREAARDILLVPMSEMGDVVHARKHILGRSNIVTDFFQKMDSIYGAQADAGSDTMAERFMIIAMWLRDSWEQMDLLERFVADTVYITPMLARTFRGHGPAGQIDSAGGGPRNWDEFVQKERVRRGVGLATKDVATARDEMNRLGASVTESIEEQIARIDALLNEKESPIDLRIYAMQVGCSIVGSVAGDQMEVETQIRGIDGVTIVKADTTSKRPLTPTSEYIIFDLKLEIVGAKNRVEYRDKILFPGLRLIDGLSIVDWTPIHRTNVRGTIRTVRENLLKEFGFTNTPHTSQHSNMNQMVTPRPALQTMIDDWSEGGVQLYDMPTDISNSSNHVMMPVEELAPLCNSVYRSDLRDFRGRYQNFIRQGAQLPVHLAIGQNGRAVITGNEDLVWFAQKAGLEELPVFIRYQKQV